MTLSHLLNDKYHGCRLDLSFPQPDCLFIFEMFKTHIMTQKTLYSPDKYSAYPGQYIPLSLTLNELQQPPAHTGKYSYKNI